MKHAPSWNKLVEHFHGDDDVVFGDETLLKNHVRQVRSVNLEPGNGGWQTTRYFNQGTGCGSSTFPKKTSQALLGQDEVHAAVRQGTGDTPLCNVNMAEKGTAPLDEDQGEVPTVGKTETQRKNPIIQSTQATQH